MPIVTFYTHGEEQVGNTASAMMFATYLGITKNQKTLLVSTSYNDPTIREGLWPPVNLKKKLPGVIPQGVTQSGIEELDRVVRSNRMSPNTITNYTRVALRERLEILDSMENGENVYEQLQGNYVSIIGMANKYYDIVIVDLDRRLSDKTKQDILTISDVVVAMTPQKISSIKKLKELINSNTILVPEKTLITLGRYDNRIKYNIKNVSRGVLKLKREVNAIPYNYLMYEGMQEGRVIDVLWKLHTVDYTNENYILIQELQKLDEYILEKKK